MSRRGRTMVFALAALWLAAVVVLTQLPTLDHPSLTLRSFLCFGCGSRDAADIALNWALFFPGGVLLAMAFGPKRAIVAAICLTVAIEGRQVWVPGRFPALQDLVSNALGASSGALLLGRGLNATGQRTLVILAGLLWLAPAALLVPMTSDAGLYSLWTPRFRGVEVYQGELVAASIGGVSTTPGPATNKSGLDRAILDRAPIRLRLAVGPATSRFSPVFQIGALDTAAVVTIGVVGDDLILRGLNRSQVLGLDQPDVRWPRALQRVAVGEVVDLVIERGRDSACMSVGSRSECGLAPSLGDGYGHLLNLETAPQWLRALAGLLWSAGLGLVLGGAATSPRAAILGGAGVALTGLLVSGLSPDVRPDVLHAAVLAAGTLIGLSLRSPLRTLWLAVNSPAL